MFLTGKEKKIGAPRGKGFLRHKKSKGVKNPKAAKITSKWGRREKSAYTIANKGIKGYRGKKNRVLEKKPEGGFGGHIRLRGLISGLYYL